MISFIASVLFHLPDVETQMTAEEIVDKILSLCPDVSRQDIMERLEREKKRTGGFISDESLLRVIAAEFGCEISNVEALMPALSFVDLVPGLGNVTVVGRVVAIFSPRTFNGNRSGKFASLLIADKEGIFRVVLWNDKANMIESGELKTGQIIRLSHGYTKEDREGKIELHMGEKCNVEINPKNVDAKDYPTIRKFATKIGELTHIHRNKKVNVVGTIRELFPVTAFQRQDSTSGKVMRFMLSDGTGEIPVVVWNEKVDELDKMLKTGAELQIVNARVKKAMGEGFELNVDSLTYVGTPTSEEEFLKVADLKEGLNRVNVEGEVASRPMLRDVKTSKQELLKLATFELKDDTGRIWVSAWRKHAEIVKDLKVGDRLTMRNAYVKRGFGDQLGLSTRIATLIAKSPSGNPN